MQAHGAVTIKTLDAAAAVGGIAGIDVSKYQGNINWAKVANSDVKFVMARASFGNQIDETFVHNALGAYSEGLLVGAYHYAKFTDYHSMMAEAELFISQLRQVYITYPVALDVEAHRGLSRAELTRLSKLFMEEVRAAGYDVMFYSYSNFFRERLDINALGDYKLWVANYKEEPALGQAIWQYTSYGSVPGISGRVDLNVAYDDWAVSQGKRVTVDAAISRSIKHTLNQRYNVGLNLDTLNMDHMNAAIDIGLQTEVNRQFGKNYDIYPTLTDIAGQHLKSINYVKGRTKGNITYLLQVRLFYKGFYRQAPSGYYDDATAQAIYEYQLEHGLYADGNLNLETLNSLLYL
jgi:GH25 family lysozyme M1 (1,4-beta-N-acetylmuramidase)